MRISSNFNLQPPFCQTVCRTWVTFFVPSVLLIITATHACADSREPVPARIPEWVHSVTRMAFVTPGQVDKAAEAKVQVVHGNAVWPYFPLRRNGGGLPPAEDKLLRKFVADCHRHGMKMILGLPPFPSVELLKKHPDWRIDPDGSGKSFKVIPDEKDLGTRLGCNNGHWGDYLIELCAELVRDYQVDGYSFDGNYHPPLCQCPACRQAYREDKKSDLPRRADLDNVAYRRYLVWRGERLEDHYRRLRQRIQQVDPNTVLVSWTVNAGRYGHFLHSPRAMPARLNRLFDLPMQEWWLDESNFGASVAPAFGAAYLRAVAGDRPNASEAYLMSRGNPYGTDSFPVHERVTRNLLALTNGSIAAEAFGWPGHEKSTFRVLDEVRQRERWITRTTRLPWAALLVSEQTRQFYAYKDIAERFLPHVFGAFRAGLEEHVPVNLINDWDITPETLSQYAVVILPNAAALSDLQVKSIREYVRSGGGLIATGETALCDDLGRPRRDFALADVFGVSYEGRPRAPLKRAELDANFAVSIDAAYWKERAGVATLSWSGHPLLKDDRLEELVPGKRVTFRGPLVRVSKPKAAAEVIVWMQPEGTEQKPLPALVARSHEKGRVVYFAAGVEAALWSYAYPYQRRLLARAIDWAAGKPAPVQVTAPLCVQATCFQQPGKSGRRLIVHLFNGLNTAANHGKPAMDVPLREEILPIHGIKVHFTGPPPRNVHLEPGHREISLRRLGNSTVAEVARLDIHAVLVAE